MGMEEKGWDWGTFHVQGAFGCSGNLTTHGASLGLARRSSAMSRVKKMFTILL